MVAECFSSLRKISPYRDVFFSPRRRLYLYEYYEDVASSPRALSLEYQCTDEFS